MVIKAWRVKWAGYVTHMGEMRNIYIVLDGKPEGRRPLGRSKHRWQDNITRDFSMWM
jgi:hypothetical protein